MDRLDVFGPDEPELLFSDVLRFEDALTFDVFRLPELRLKLEFGFAGIWCGNDGGMFSEGGGT